MSHLVVKATRRNQRHPLKSTNQIVSSMKASRRLHRPLRRSGVKDYEKFYSTTTATTSTPLPKSSKQKISTDLIIAYEATERIAKNLDALMEDCDFSSHRLWRESLTSNRSILSNLIDTITSIKARVDETSPQLEYPDYFTK